MGVLPRPRRIRRRHDRPHRGPGRAVRTRVPRPHPRPRDTLAGADGGTRPELRRRRHQRRHLGHPPAPLPAEPSPRSVPRGPGAVPVLVIDAARRRGPRHERLSRRPVGACGGTCGETSRRPRAPTSRRSHQPSHSAPAAGIVIQTSSTAARTVALERRSAKPSSTTPPRRSSATRPSRAPSALSEVAFATNARSVALEVRGDQVEALVESVEVGGHASEQNRPRRRAAGGRGSRTARAGSRPSAGRSGRRRWPAPSDARPVGCAPSCPRRTSPTCRHRPGRPTSDRASRRPRRSGSRPARPPPRSGPRPRRRAIRATSARTRPMTP